MPLVLPLVAVDVLVTVLLALACSLLIAVILKEVATLVSGIPGVGGPLARAINGMASAITGALWAAVHESLALLGASWHALARLLDKAWQLGENYALGYVQLAELVASLVYAHSGLRSLIHRLEATFHGIEHRVKTFEREWHGIEAKVKRIEHDLTRGIGHDLRIGLRDLRGEVKSVEHTVTTTIPKAIDAAEAQTTALGRFIGAIPGIKYAEWVAGLVAAGLAALGFSWLSCKENPFNNNPKACSMLGDLGRFLPLLGLLALAFDFPEFVATAEEVATGIGDLVAGIEGSFAVALPPLPAPTV